MEPTGAGAEGTVEGKPGPMAEMASKLETQADQVKQAFATQTPQCGNPMLDDVIGVLGSHLGSVTTSLCKNTTTTAAFVRETAADFEKADGQQ